jgi:hypothetical protein
MIWGAATATASAVTLAFLTLLAVPGAHGWMLLALSRGPPADGADPHRGAGGAQDARRRHGGGDRRTEDVAVANTAMGALLLGAGAVSSVLAILGAETALAFLALLGAAGVLTARTLPEVSARSPIPNSSYPALAATSPSTPAARTECVRPVSGCPVLLGPGRTR